MWLRRLLWWMNGRSLDEAVAQLRTETAKMQYITAESAQRHELWEAERMRNVWLKKSDVSSPPEVSLNDDLTTWLWHAAFNACRQTGDWDLLNACAGIAHAIRTEGIPLSPGLSATAVRARSGLTDAESE
jgi:aminoglycoside phosphotransferase